MFFLNEYLLSAYHAPGIMLNIRFRFSHILKQNQEAGTLIHPIVQVGKVRPASEWQRFEVGSG